MKKSSPTKTQEREKYAIWLDKEDLQALREFQRAVGVPVSESVRRAINLYVKTLPKKR